MGELAMARIPKQSIAIIEPQIINVLRPYLSEKLPKIYPKAIDTNNATLIIIPISTGSIECSFLMIIVIKGQIMKKQARVKNVPIKITHISFGKESKLFNGKIISPKLFISH